MRKVLSCSSIFLGTMLLTANVFAAGKVVIHPMVEVGLEHNTNYWKAESNEVSVNTYSLKPGITLGFEAPKTSIMLETVLEAFWYDDLDTRPVGVRDASDDDYVGFMGKLSVDHQLTDRMNIGVNDELFITRDQANADTQSNSVDRSKFTINYFEPYAYYELTRKFGLMAAYRNTITDYEKNLEDSTEHRGIYDLYYYLNRDSAIYLDYQIWYRDYDQTSSDYTSNKITLNYEKSYKYFTITGGAGYHNRDFTSSKVDDIDMFSWGVSIERLDPEKTVKTSKSHLLIELGQEMNDDGSGNTYFTSTYFNVEGGYRFFERVYGGLAASFQNSDYETSNRDEDTYFLSAKIGYNILENLVVALEGGLETRESNIVGNDYDDAFVMLTLNFDYDFSSR